MDLVSLVVWMFLIGFLFMSMLILARILFSRKKAKVLHQLSGDTFALLNGEIKFNKLNVKNYKFDLHGIKSYMLRTATGFKPFFITSHTRNRPLQIKGDWLESEKLPPSTIQSMGKIEALNFLIKSSMGRLNLTTIIFSVMAFVIGLLLGIVGMSTMGGA
ncbi:MAG: hypothetical protein AM326_08220 [Candidatus Thorarchaeota archaeon SMTZ-45]|nr:MAG: hypothetical protein AM326_08220 [Candidatus Thorarchaeota archaeon SMTZ-45]